MPLNDFHKNFEPLQIKKINTCLLCLSNLAANELFPYGRCCKM